MELGLRHLLDVHTEASIQGGGHGRLVQKSDKGAVCQNWQWILVSTVKRDKVDAAGKPSKQAKRQATLKKLGIKGLITAD